MQLNATMSRPQVILLVIMTAAMTGLAGYLNWPATGSPITALGIAVIIGIIVWQAWQRRHNPELRDVTLASAWVAAAIALLLAADAHDLASELHEQKTSDFCCETVGHVDGEYGYGRGCGLATKAQLATCGAALSCPSGYSRSGDAVTCRL
jgi:hypothetical protein